MGNDRTFLDVITKPESLAELRYFVDAQPVSDADSRWQKQVLLRLMDFMAAEYIDNSEFKPAAPDTVPANVGVVIVTPDTVPVTAGETSINPEENIVPPEGITGEHSSVRVVSDDELTKEQREIIQQHTEISKGQSA